jgi:hypothetical protein
VIEAFAVADVYAAESTLMQTLAEGELMARAVEGLIEVVSARIEQLGAQRVVALVGTGNNGADALYAVAYNPFPLGFPRHRRLKRGSIRRVAEGSHSSP